ALALAESVPHEGIISGVGDFDLNLAPGQKEVTQTATTTMQTSPVPISIHGVFPHMHRFGRTQRLEVQQGGKTSCLVDVPDWSFSWQQFYFYEKPFVIQPGGGSTTITCTYDTTDAKKTLHFGEGTGDEMCLTGVYYSL